MSAAAETKYSLVLKDGTLVIPGVGMVKADVGISGGKIVALGNDLAGRAEDVLDASGKTVLPGIFDPHVHIGNERSFEEEAETETRAAVLGGVTTIGIFLRSLEDSYMLHLPSFRHAMDELSYVDFGFPPADIYGRADCRDSALCEGFRHPFLQILHVRNAGHREIHHR